MYHQDLLGHTAFYLDENKKVQPLSIHRDLKESYKNTFRLRMPNEQELKVWLEMNQVTKKR